MTPRTILISFAAFAFALGAYCSDGDGGDSDAIPTAPAGRDLDGAVSPTVTATASRTSALILRTTLVPETDGLEGFRAFATQIDRAVDQNDASFLGERALGTEVRCGGTYPFGACGNQPSGSTITGIFRGTWRSEFLELLTPEELAIQTRARIGNSLSELRDDYGSGHASLYALASSCKALRTHQETSCAVITFIQHVRRGPPQRVTWLLPFTFVDGRWHLRGYVTVDADMSPEWLSANCLDCYTHWERWEDSQ